MHSKTCKIINKGASTMSMRQRRSIVMRNADESKEDRVICWSYCFSSASVVKMISACMMDRKKEVEPRGSAVIADCPRLDTCTVRVKFDGRLTESRSTISRLAWRRSDAEVESSFTHEEMDVVSLSTTDFESTTTLKFWKCYLTWKDRNTNSSQTSWLSREIVRQYPFDFHTCVTSFHLLVCAFKSVSCVHSLFCLCSSYASVSLLYSSSNLFRKNIAQYLWCLYLLCIRSCPRDLWLRTCVCGLYSCSVLVIVWISLTLTQIDTRIDCVEGQSYVNQQEVKSIMIDRDSHPDVTYVLDSDEAKKEDRFTDRSVWNSEDVHAKAFMTRAPQHVARDCQAQTRDCQAQMNSWEDAC